MKRILAIALAAAFLAFAGYVGVSAISSSPSASAATATAVASTSAPSAGATTVAAGATTVAADEPAVEETTSTSDWVLIAIEGLLVIGLIAMGVRSGGVGLGLWGGVGTLILVFVFGLEPGEPPVDAMLIIVAVIAAAAAMQAAGGIDYMVVIASKALRAQPKRINFVAPFVSYVLCILTGTSNTFYSIIPVINEVAYANKIRPGTTAGGVDGRLGARHHLEPGGGRDGDPAAARGDLQLRADRRPADHHPGQHRRHLRDVRRDEPARQGISIRTRSTCAGSRRARSSRRRRRARSCCMPFAKRSVAIFLGAVLVICIFGLFEDLRPTILAEDGGTKPLSVTPDHPDGHADRRGADAGLLQGQGVGHPEHVDLQIGHGRDDRPLRHRLDGGHVHRQQRGRDRVGPGRPREPVALHDRGGHLRGRGVDDKPIGGNAEPWCRSASRWVSAPRT